MSDLRLRKDVVSRAQFASLTWVRKHSVTFCHVTTVMCFRDAHTLEKFLTLFVFYAAPI